MAEVNVQAVFGSDVEKARFSNGVVVALEAKTTDGANRIYRATKTVAELFGGGMSFSVEGNAVRLSYAEEDRALLMKIMSLLHRHYEWPTAFES